MTKRTLEKIADKFVTGMVFAAGTVAVIYGDIFRPNNIRIKPIVREYPINWRYEEYQKNTNGGLK